VSEEYEKYLHELLGRDMRIALKKYAGITGVTLFETETGERRILPTAFFLALKDMGRKLKEIASAPTIDELIARYPVYSKWEDLVGL